MEPSALNGVVTERRVVVRRAVREVLFVAVLFFAYKLGRLLVEGHVGAATTNAQHVWDFERLVHLPSEASLQAALLSHTLWIRVANCFYAYVHFPATAAALVWLYLRRPEIYRWFRRTLASLTALALVIHALFPLAPPRMLTTAGLVDTGHLYGPSVYGSPSTDTLSNQYAAMPSLHVAWALAVAIALIAATRSRRRWLWPAHPIMTLLVVVVTGNHYWLDAIAAVALLALVLAVVTPLSRQSAQPAAGPTPRTALAPARLGGRPFVASRPGGRTLPATRAGDRRIPAPRRGGLPAPRPGEPALPAAGSGRPAAGSGRPAADAPRPGKLAVPAAGSGLPAADAPGPGDPAVRLAGGSGLPAADPPRPGVPAVWPGAPSPALAGLAAIAMPSAVPLLHGIDPGVVPPAPVGGHPTAGREVAGGPRPAAELPGQRTVVPADLADSPAVPVTTCAPMTRIEGSPLTRPPGSRTTTRPGPSGPRSRHPHAR
jgi:hypothetical protein